MGIRRRGKWLLRGTLAYVAFCLCLAAGSTLFTRDCSIIRAPYDVAIVLGGGLDTLHFVRDQKLGRIDAAVALFDRDRITRLHLSGGGDDQTSSTARALARIAMDSGVPAIVITQETQSLSTLQNAFFSLPDLPEDASLLIVTEGYHAWRSWASFVWAGRSGDVCASLSPGRKPKQKAMVIVRETAAWGANIPRAGLWSLGEWLGLEGRMPTALLR